jgi:uncharacterized protein YgbK (DUF1537 family)
MQTSENEKDSASMDCLLVADDLTGACDAAVHFAIRGLRADVLYSRQAQATGARVLAITTESRDLSPAEVRRAMTAAAAAFPVDASTLVFKKIDSTLRGNTGLEIAAALDAFGCDAAVVCPAFPAMGRVVESGLLRIPWSAEFAPISVAGLVRLQSGHACAHTRHDGVAALR